MTDAHRFLAAMAAAVVLAAGCAGPEPVERQTAETDFDYPRPQRESDTGVTFVMIEPRLRSASDIAMTNEQHGVPFIDLTLLFQQQAVIQVEDADPAINPFQSRYIEFYQPRIEAALNKDIREMLQAKGFRAEAVFERYEDIGSDQRRDALLVTVPTATLALTRKIERSDCKAGYCAEHGRLRLDGQFLFQLVEPESGATVAIRRMNLHSLRIEESYVKYTSDGGEAAAADPPGRMLDTSDRALVQVLNRFYASMMTEVDHLVSRRQILAFNASMKSLESEAGSPGGP